jgi:hypothetical protein
MGLNRMMMKNGQSKQLYHLKSSYVQIGDQDNPITFLGFCAEEIQDDFFGTIPPMGSLSPNEYCGAKIKNVLMDVNPDEGVGYFGIVDFYGKLPENAIGEYELLDFRIPQLNVFWVSTARYNESTNTTSCISDEDYFVFDGIDSLKNLYITIAPHVSSYSK